MPVRPLPRRKLIAPLPEDTANAMSSDLPTGQEKTREQEGAMRRLILQTGVSIDGYVAALDRSHPWSDGSDDEGVKRWILDSVWAAGAHLMGRVTYEEMAAFWPTSTSEYARPMNEIPKVVFSTTLQHAAWPETRIARGDLAEEIGRLKREPGNDLIAYGGATLDQALTRFGLVDEYRLMIQPAALGAGLALFKDLSAPLHLELVEATTYATGVAIHVYRPRSSPAEQPVDPDQPEQVK
jgi:dihydrofolate reductase